MSFPIVEGSDLISCVPSDLNSVHCVCLIHYRQRSDASSFEGCRHFARSKGSNGTDRTVPVILNPLFGKVNCGRTGQPFRAQGLARAEEDVSIWAKDDASKLLRKKEVVFILGIDEYSGKW